MVKSHKLLTTTVLYAVYKRNPSHPSLKRALLSNLCEFHTDYAGDRACGEPARQQAEVKGLVPPRVQHQASAALDATTS